MDESSNICIFNINKSNWQQCVTGPENSDFHDERSIGNPCQGVRPNSKVPATRLEPGDLVLARRTGGSEKGVKGIWEYRDKVDVSEKPGASLWSDTDYQWILYCDPIQRELDTPFEEDWEEITELLNLESIYSATGKIQGAVSGIDSDLENYYLENLIAHEAINDQARNRLKEEFDKQTSSLPVLDTQYSIDCGDKLTAPNKEPLEAVKIERQLLKARQLVFYGPPGTGKTYTARQFARWWLNQQSDFTPSKEQLETVTFHPSFSYEDFIEGLTAEADGGAVEYRIEDGVFKRICKRATTAYQHAKHNDDIDEARRFVLIVDEINRGNLAQIFGETITLLESDKRLDQPNEVEITLAHSRESFTVPPNLYVIGTMNTADRSIALVDAALRRRFRFLAFPPNYSVVIDHHGFDGLDEIHDTARMSVDPFQSLIALSVLAVRELNETIVDTPDLGKGKQIGHSYLMNFDDADDIVDAWKYEILPLLEEYYFGQFVRIREELFQTSGGRLFHWETEEIADFTRDDLRRSLADFVGIELVEPEVNGDAVEGEETVYTLNLLLDEGVLQAGDELVFDEEKVPENSDPPYDPSDSFWRCEVTGRVGQSNGVRWLFNNEEYSFSGVAQAILEQASDHRSRVSGTSYFRHPDFDNKLLVELRDEVQSGALTNANREN
ncbi:McrB family protein [Haladaptatus pallidirubidus]|nr:AAA family ATPase [Haladaptatus pallidirubidus]